MYRLFTVNLEQKVALAINVIAADSLGRSDENNHFIALDIRGQIFADECFELRHRFVQQNFVVWIVLRLL